MINELENEDTRLIEAEVLARKLLITQPDNPDAFNSLGLILIERARYLAAADQFLLATERDPEREDLKINLFRALSEAARTAAASGAFETAIDYLKRCLALDPDRIETVCHLAFSLYSCGRFKESLELADKAIDIKGAHAHAHDVRGLALLGLDKLNEAIFSFRKALAINPDFSSAHNNLGTALLAQKEHVLAREHFEIAAKLEPDNAMTFNNLGLTQAEVANFDRAEEYLREAIAIAPDFAEAHFNLGRVLLMQGEYEEGWQENEWRWQCRSFPSTWREFPYPRLGDRNVSGKTILVWSEQGLGDEIMFAGPIADLITDGASVVIECDERLVDIFRRSFDGATVVSRDNPPNPIIEQSGIDYQTPIGSLCKWYRNSREDFAASNRQYLRADPIRKAELARHYRELGNGPLVGICWRSGNPIAGEERSAPLGLWDPILQAPCTFISLQYGPVDDDILSVRERLGVEVLVDRNVNPLESAEDWFAQVAAMDIVISIDNSTIQVSGSQGVPTWTLLSYLPEWRFCNEGTSHDWHQSIRVYRQPKPGDWHTVFNAVSVDFAKWLKTS